MPFCPICRIEYREGFATCSDCDMDLVSQLPPEEPDIRETLKDEESTPIFVTSDSVEAEIVQGVLDDAGIRSYLTPDATRHMRTIGMGAVNGLYQRTIYVLECDVERARTVIEQTVISSSEDGSSSER